jgi:hypothetical protein
LARSIFAFPPGSSDSVRIEAEAFILDHLDLTLTQTGDTGGLAGWVGTLEVIESLMGA